MGKANRERRRAKEKQRKRGQQQSTGTEQPQGPFWQWPSADQGPTPEQRADRLLADAVNAWVRGEEDALRRHSARLAERPGDGGWARAVDRMAMRWLTRGVTGAWERGWQPAEVVRYVTRELGRRPARMAADVIAAELRGYSAATVDERWPDQLSALGAEVWWKRDDLYPGGWSEREGVDRTATIGTVISVAALMHTLPPLEQLCPPPGRARRGARGPRTAEADVADQRMLRKVRALLDKAESTEFAEEAEALTARAQELMTRYSIDAALLQAGSAVRVEPVGARLGIDAPYEESKALLLQVVAQANRCRTVWHKALGMTTVVGFPTDLRAVELLFTSLLVQATTAMVAAGSKQNAWGGSRTRSFRQSFLSAYGERIGERLLGATDEAVQQAAAETGRGDLLPVLAARDRAVDEAVAGLFPEVTERAVRGGTDREGWLSGREAADRAQLRAFTEVEEQGPR